MGDTGHHPGKKGWIVANFDDERLEGLVVPV